MAEQHSQQLDLENVREEFAQKAQEMVGHAVEFAREKPHVAIGVAFGIGWVLGNGLPPRVIMAAARMGWKAALGGALASSGLLGGLLGGDEEEPEPRPHSSRPKRQGTGAEGGAARSRASGAGTAATKD